MMADGERRLPPGVHGRAVGRVGHVGPHPGPVGPGADGVDVVAEELVIDDVLNGVVKALYATYTRDPSGAMPGAVYIARSPGRDTVSGADQV